MVYERCVAENDQILQIYDYEIVPSIYGLDFRRDALQKNDFPIFRIISL